MAPRADWQEIAWPFPRDGWPAGRAFRCKGEGCGVEVEIYVRPKIGFCNCTTGVSDDDELDRLSDYRLMGSKPAVLEQGRPIKVAWMEGRSRSYTVANPGNSAQSALAIAFNDHCDAVVATAVVAQSRPTAIEPVVVAFLNSQVIVRWTKATLGL